MNKRQKKKHDVENLINDLMSAKNSEEILLFKPQVLKLYNEIYEKICSQGCSITNYDDINMLHKLDCPMQAYYGPYFYDELGVPFLKEHNPQTIDILNFIVLFYSLQIVNLLENGLFNQTSRCIYKNPMDEFFERTEEINLTDNTQNLFASLWTYFENIINIEDDTRVFIMEYDYKSCKSPEKFYLTDKEYEVVVDTIYQNLDNSHYFCVLNKILGQYKIRFTKMQYIIKYQPLFVNVAYNYLHTF